jgi:predicted DNA binding CopG/RHH family protein
MAKEKKTIAPRMTVAEPAQDRTSAEEALLNALQAQEKTSRKKDVHRLTLDIPEVVFDKIKAESHGKGYTYRELIVTVLRKYFGLE